MANMALRPAMLLAAAALALLMSAGVAMAATKPPYCYKNFKIGLNNTAAQNFVNGHPIEATDPGPGVLVTFKQLLNDEKFEQQVGFAYGTGSFVNLDAEGVDVWMNGELSLELGSIAWQGIFSQRQNVTSYFSIVGGTRKYKGAGGVLKLASLGGQIGIAELGDMWLYSVELLQNPSC